MLLIFYLFFLSGVQAVRRGSMGNCAIKSATAPIMAAATGPTEPVCVTLDSMDAFVTSVSPSIIPNYLFQ